MAFAKNPGEPFDNSLGREVDPATWRQLELKVDRSMGGGADVVLLRPQWWIEQRLENGGQLLTLTIPELAINGPAQVLSIGPCPPLSPGEGSVVIGTFVYQSDQSVNLYVEGDASPIHCTPNHPFWSEDRQRYIDAQELHAGERLRARGGYPRVSHVEHHAKPLLVFNLEIHGQHVYEVCQSGILVHNAPSGRGEVLVRRGSDPESARRLGRQSQQAEDAGFPHGVSVTTPESNAKLARDPNDASAATRGEFEDAGFPVHDTPTRRDPNHKTVELPKPVTPDDAKNFNDVLGRTQKGKP